MIQAVYRTGLTRQQKMCIGLTLTENKVKSLFAGMQCFFPISYIALIVLPQINSWFDHFCVNIDQPGNPAF